MPKLKRDLIISSAVTLTLLLAAALRMAGTENGFAMLLNNKWLQLAVATAAQLFAGTRFYKKAFQKNCAGVDMLVALASASAFLLSIYNGFINPVGVGAIYFESPSALVTLALLGEYLEQSAAGHTPDYVKKLSVLGAKTARVRRIGEELEIPAEQVVPGDIVLVRSGEIIPVDGEILSGLAGVDESALSGESTAADKQPGDNVLAATVCTYGELEMKAEKVGSNTIFSHIMSTLCEPRGSKISVCEAFKNILGFYVPAAIFVSFAVFVWQWLSTGGLLPAFTGAASALMAACPFALGLAAPAVLRAMAVNAAGKGIIFTGGGHLNARMPDVALVGKTGIITDGKPEITDIFAFSGFFEEEVVSFAASASKNSTHPIDKAIYGHTQPKVILGGLSENVVRSGDDELVTMRSELHGFIGSVPEAEEFESLPGHGVRAVVGGREILLGSRRLLRGNGVDFSAYENILSKLESVGKTVTLVAIRRKAAGVIATADQLCDNARQSVDMLKALGVEVYLLTGDSARTAKLLGRYVGIDNVIADILPPDKAAGISRLKETGKTVAVIGCGASDSPAIAAADFGIAANFVAPPNAAEITLMRGGLDHACEAISLSTAATQSIRRNLILSLSCNAAGIILAAAGAFPPAIMAAVMAFTCVLCSLNPSNISR